MFFVRISRLNGAAYEEKSVRASEKNDEVVKRKMDEMRR